MSDVQFTTDAIEHSSKSNKTPASSDSTKEKPKPKRENKELKKIERLKKVASGMGGGPTGELPSTGENFACIISKGDGLQRLIRISPENVVTEVSDDVFHRATASYLTESAGAIYPDLRFFKPSDLDHVLRYFCVSSPLVDEDDVRFVAWKCESNTLCYTRLPWTKADISLATYPTPFWDSVLAQMKGNQDAFMWFIGSLFDEHSDKSQYLYLWGEGGSGKSRIVAFLKEVFRQGATVTLPPQKDNRFWFASVYKSRVVMLSDVEDYRVVNSAQVKILTGDGELPVEKKGVPVFGAKSNCKLLMCSNHPPGISSDTADLRRLLEIEMDAVENKIAAEELDALLLQEAPAFLRRCVETYESHTQKNGRVAFTSENMRHTITSRSEDNEADFFSTFDEYLFFDDDICTTTNELRAVAERKNWDFKTYRGFVNWLKRRRPKELKRKIKYTNKHLMNDPNTYITAGYYGVGIKASERKAIGSTTPKWPYWSQRTAADWVKFVRSLGHNVGAGAVKTGIRAEINDFEGEGPRWTPADC